MNFFENDNLTALEAKEKAQWLAFAPVVFQATKALRDTGILSAIDEMADGLTQEEVVAKLNLPKYGVRVLMEAALGIGLLTVHESRYKITKTGTFILHDRLTQVNMDFVQDVCYQGMFHLNESIRHEKPEGLKVFGSWPTIYEGLSSLPQHVQKSWFAFDHFYSDYSFPDALSYVFECKPNTLLDIGGNTGKWAMECAAYDQDVKITIMDLPGQVAMARKQIAAKGMSDRIDFYECNLLDESQPFPTGYDAIWMSQFLDCFSEEQIKSILRRCKGALSPKGKIFILEPFWDKQRFETSAFVLQQTSLYFTAMANGNSQMYAFENFVRYIHESGFNVTAQKGLIGVSHTLLICEVQ